ncbi:hypothetical protein ABFS83_12G117000 [Erythranthe nasuta]
MATLPPSTLQLPNPRATFPSSPRPNLPFKLHAPPRAVPEDSSSASTPTDPAPEQDSDSFEDRLLQVRLRNRSGTGKKAEARKTRKGKKPGSGSSSSGSNVFLPPVPLKEPVSEGLKVEFGFSPYSERINGRIALLGLTAMLLVELATGKSVINYHSPSIIFIQVYFVAVVSALYVKIQKENVSVWPQSDK